MVAMHYPWSCLLVMLHAEEQLGGITVTVTVNCLFRYTATRTADGFYWGEASGRAGYVPL